MYHWQKPLRTIKVRLQSGEGTSPATPTGRVPKHAMPASSHCDGFQSKPCSVEHAVPYLKKHREEGKTNMCSELQPLCR